MCVLFCNFFLVQYYNLVSLVYCIQVVGYYYNGLAFEKVVQVINDFVFIISIKGVGGFIKEQKIRSFVDSVGDEQLLLLFLIDVVVYSINFGIVLQWQVINKGFQIGQFYCFQKVFWVYGGVVFCNIIGDGI